MAIVSNGAFLDGCTAIDHNTFVQSRLTWPFWLKASPEGGRLCFLDLPASGELGMYSLDSSVSRTGVFYYSDAHMLTTPSMATAGQLWLSQWFDPGNLLQERQHGLEILVHCSRRTVPHHVTHPLFRFEVSRVTEMAHCLRKNPRGC